MVTLLATHMYVASVVVSLSFYVPLMTKDPMDNGCNHHKDLLKACLPVNKISEIFWQWLGILSEHTSKLHVVSSPFAFSEAMV